MLRIVLGFVFASFAAVAMAQTEAADKMDELDIALWDQVRVAADYANAECQALPGVKRFNELRSKNLKKIEDRHPGYTINDLGTGLVAIKK